MNRESSRASRLTMGWREWVSLPDFGVAIKAKVDTGARTSALHVSGLRVLHCGDAERAHFTIHPWQRSPAGAVEASAEIRTWRRVRSSNGVVEHRPVIATRLDWKARSWIIELSLTSRDQMGFRMLLGREAARRVGLVDPRRSFLGGVPQEPKPPTKGAPHS